MSDSPGMQQLKAAAREAERHRQQSVESIAWAVVRLLAEEGISPPNQDRFAEGIANLLDEHLV